MGLEKNTPNVPNFRFPEFKDEWHPTKLGTLFTAISDSVDMDDEQTYELVTVKRNLGGIVSRGLMLGKDIKVKSQYYLKADCLLFSKRQISHKACGIIPEKFNRAIVSNEYSILEANSALSTQFFFLYCHRPKMYQSFYLSSIGVHIEKMIFKLDDWLKRKFPFPSLPEQEKIANFLSDVDAKIENLTQQKACMQQYKKGCMQKLFSQELRFKDDDGNTFPDWEEKKLGELFEFFTTSSLSRDKLTYTPTPIAYIHYGDIHKRYRSRFIFSKEEVPYIIEDEVHHIKLKGEFCKEGDIIFADASEDYADIGKCIELIELEGKTIEAGLHTIHARKKYDSAIGFYSHLFQSETVRKSIMYIAQGTKVLGISPRLIKNIFVKIPSLPEQEKIANLLSAIDEKIEVLDKQLEVMKKFKKGLLQGMFV